MRKWLKRLTKRPKYSIGQIITNSRDEIEVITGRYFELTISDYIYNISSYDHIFEQTVTDQLLKYGDLGCL